MCKKCAKSSNLIIIPYRVVTKLLVKKEKIEKVEKMKLAIQKRLKKYLL